MSNPNGKRLRVALLAVCLSLNTAGVVAQEPPRFHEDISKLTDAGEYAKAEALARERLAEIEADPEADPLDIAAILDVLFAALMRGGKATAEETVAFAERALAIREEQQGDADPETINSLSHVAIIKFLAGDYTAARSYFERVVAGQTAVLGAEAIQTARSINNLALVLWRLGEYDDALQRYERALSIIEKHRGPEHPEVASVLNNIGLILWRMADYTGAQSHFERTLEIRLAALGEAHPDVALTYNNLGILLRDVGDYTAARPYLERAVASYEQALGPRHPDLARALSGLGSVLQWLGEYNQARSFYERSLEINLAVLGPDHPNVAGVRSHLGTLEYNAGNYPAARVQYDAALRINEAALGPEHPAVAGALHLLGQVIGAMGDTQEAVALGRRSLEIRERALGENHPLVAVSLNSLASNSVDSNRREAAELYRRAVAIYEQTLGPDHYSTLEATSNLALVTHMAGDIAEAEALFEKVIAIQERALGPNHIALASTLTNYAHLFMREDGVETGLALCDRAAEIVERVLGPNHESMAEVLALRSKLLTIDGEWEAARVAAIRATAIEGAHRRAAIRLLPERQALLAAASGYGSERPLFASLIANGDAASVEACWNWTLQHRGAALDELAARHNNALAEESADAQAALRRLAEARQHLASVWVRGTETGDPAKFQRQVEVARQQKESAERELARVSVAFRTQRDAREITLNDLAAALPEGSALVEIVRIHLWTREEILAPVHDVAMILPTEGSATFVDLGRSERTDRLVADWRAALETTAHDLLQSKVESAAMDSVEDTGLRLRKAIWDPLARRVGKASTIFIVPDGALHHVDFGALPAGGGKFVAETAPPIQLLGTGRDVLRHADRPPHASRGALLVGNPVFGATDGSAVRGAKSSCLGQLGIEWSPLPESEAEVLRIGKLFGESGDVSILTGAAADEGTLKAKAPGKRVVHLATHGFFLEQGCDGTTTSSSSPWSSLGARETPGNPLLLSGLVLAGANHAGDVQDGEEDGILTAEELAALNLEGTELVVLSACETGRGSVVTGQGVLGLRRAIELAGASSVVMSLWPVPDRWARRWMITMYDAWLDDTPVVEAARQASLANLKRLRAQGRPPHPYWWSGFVTVGDWR